MTKFHRRIYTIKIASRIAHPLSFLELLAAGGPRLCSGFRSSTMSAFDVFDDDDEEDVATPVAYQVTAALLVRLRSDRSASWNRVVLLPSTAENEVWIQALRDRSFVVASSLEENPSCDVVIWIGTPGDGMNTKSGTTTTNNDHASILLDQAGGRLVPGGYWIYPTISDDTCVRPNNVEWTANDNNQQLCPGWLLSERASCSIATETCPWHQSVHSKESRRVSVVPLSASERHDHTMSSPTRDRVVHHVLEHGYCVIPGLLCPQTCAAYGQAILADMHTAAAILQQNGGRNLYQPADTETGTYREISLREDWRLDLRDGPALRACRHEYADGLNSHPDLMAICVALLFPSDPYLARGNYGKYNFANNNTQKNRLSCSPIGGIVSLPGAADQAVHADTPHLFEVGPHLPPHYVNLFAGAIPAAAGVGPTALVHGSHRREYVAQYHTNEVLQPEVWNDLVRPRLEPGDVLVMDCRILHFGLANTHATVERPLLYSNVTAHWFHDPKNWDNEEPIFQSLDVPS